MLALILYFLTVSPAHGESFAKKPGTLSAENSKALDFVKSLPYLIYENSWLESPNPSVVPNIWGCGIAWSFVDECMDREKLQLPATSSCPVNVDVTFEKKGCDLQAEGLYTLPNKNPLEMAFQVRNSAEIKRVTFTFRFATTVNRTPTPATTQKTGLLPWGISKQAIAIRLEKGHLYGTEGVLLADFDLQYGLSSRDSQVGKEKFVNEGGKVKITFPTKGSVEQSFLFPFFQK